MVSPTQYGHHAYTNVISKDPDLYHNNYFKRLTPEIKFKPIYKIQHLTIYLEWITSYIGIVILPILNYIQHGFYFNYIYAHQDYWLSMIDYVHILISLILSFSPLFLFDWYKGLILSLVPKMITLYIYVILK